MIKDWKSSLHSLQPHLLAWIWSVLLLLQMGLAFLAFREPRLPELRDVGWAIWALGTVFAILPIFTLRTRGRVPEGKSYMETTALVDAGIYAIARHPQGGTAGILFNLALALIGQHWLLVVLAAVGMVLIYMDTFKADEACIQKFGEEYVRYMQRVPRVNFLAGFLRLLVHPRLESTEVWSISDFCLQGAEAGVGMALQDDEGRYLFFIAGTRHRCPPGERFYAGIGGHREAGESWLACAHREALEEVGTDVNILSAPLTWYIPRHRPARQIEVTDRPRPLALYEMIHPPGTPRVGEVYRIVVYQARLRSMPRNLPEDEVLAMIALTAEQVIRGPERKPTLAELLDEGARIVASAELVDSQICLYPLGTASALAYVLRHTQGPPVLAEKARQPEKQRVRMW